MESRDVERKGARKLFLFIAAIGLFVRFFLLCWYLMTHQGRVETWEYEQVALNLLDGKGYILEDYAAASHSFGSPLFPFLSYVLHWIGGRENFILFLCLQFLFSLGLMALIHRFALRLFGSRTALLTALFVALEPGLVLFGSYRVHEMTLAVFLTVAAMVFFAAFRDRLKISTALLLGFILGFGFLTRPTILAILPMLVLWLILEGRRSRAVVCIFAVAMGAALTVLPWAFRNYKTYGSWVLLSRNWSEALWRGNNPEGIGSNLTKDGKPIFSTAQQEFQEKILEATEQERAQLFKEQALGYMASHPLEFAWQCAKKFWYFWWFTPTYGMTYAQIPHLLKKSYQVLYGMILSLAVWGWISAMRLLQRDRWLLAVYLSVFALSTALLHAAAYVEGRHKLIVMPFILMFSAFGVVTLRDRLPWRIAIHVRP